jgi:hypothetical protein
MPVRPIVRREPRIGGDADTPEETVPEEGHELFRSVGGPGLAFISLFHGRKRDLGFLMALRMQVDKCACHVKHV